MVRLLGWRLVLVGGRLAARWIVIISRGTWLNVGGVGVRLLGPCRSAVGVRTGRRGLRRFLLIATDELIQEEGLWVGLIKGVGHVRTRHLNFPMKEMSTNLDVGVKKGLIGIAQSAIVRGERLPTIGLEALENLSVSEYGWIMVRVDQCQEEIGSKPMELGL